MSDGQGKYEIKASMRPDGTWRKPRKVKEGYIPQDEVPKYESKGKLFGQKPTLPVGFCPKVVAESRASASAKTQLQPKKIPSVPGLLVIKKEPKKDKQSTPKTPTAINATKVPELEEMFEDALEIDPLLDIYKRLKRLRRKIRDIEVLEQKLKAGEKPEKDQLEKIERKHEIMIEIHELEVERDVLKKDTPQ
ncbi:unnamed protein product [Diamesa serratosioi]